VLPGTVQAWYEAPIYARVAHVKKRDVLATIETPELDAPLATAKAKLEAAKAQVKVCEAEKKFAQTTYERWKNSPKGAVSVQEVESKEADYYTGIARCDERGGDVISKSLLTREIGRPLPGNDRLNLFLREVATRQLDNARKSRSRHG